MAVADSSDVDVTGDESECEDGELTQDSSTSYSAGLDGDPASSCSTECASGPPPVDETVAKRRVAIIDIQCPFCSKLCTSRHNLERHISVHTGERPFGCDFCQRCFTTKGSLLRHCRNLHRGITSTLTILNAAKKRPTCSICGKECSIPARLKQHMKVHAKAADIPSSKQSRVRRIAPDSEKNGKRLLSSKQKQHVRGHAAKKPYQCDTCGQAFPHKRILQRHCLRQHFRNDMIKNPSKQTCAYCGMSFPFPSGLKRHLMVHNGEEEEEEEDLGIVTTSISVSPAPTTKQDRTCQICREMFAFPSYMKRHMLNHTGEMPFQCHKCKVAFSSRKNLKIHYVKKHGKSAPPDKAPRRVEKAAKVTLCSICGKLLKSPFLLERHMRKHTGEKPFKCDRCGRSFSSKGNLQRHMRVHTGQVGGKPIECAVCPAKFSDKGSLKKHCVRVHTKSILAPTANDEMAAGKESVRVHVCPLCGTFFKYLCLLNRHMTVHIQSSEKQFECEVCHKYFTRKGNLKTHLKKIHTDPATSPSDKTFECDVCNRTFNSKATLNAHRKKKHNDLAASGVSPTSDRTCPHCGEFFAYPSAMKQHVTVHTGERPFGCDVCNKSFSRKASLNCHQKKMHTDLATEQDRTCPICGLVFDFPSRMKRHMIQHTGEKPYQCSICVEYFSQAAALEEHHQKMHKKGKERIPAKDRTCKFCDAMFSTIAELVCHSQKECA